MKGYTELTDDINGVGGSYPLWKDMRTAICRAGGHCYTPSLGNCLLNWQRRHVRTVLYNGVESSIFINRFQPQVNRADRLEPERWRVIGLQIVRRFQNGTDLTAVLDATGWEWDQVEHGRDWFEWYAARWKVTGHGPHARGTLSVGV